MQWEKKWNENFKPITNGIQYEKYIYLCLHSNKSYIYGFFFSYTQRERERFFPYNKTPIQMNMHFRSNKKREKANMKCFVITRALFLCCVCCSLLLFSFLLFKANVFGQFPLRLWLLIEMLTMSFFMLYFSIHIGTIYAAPIYDFLTGYLSMRNFWIEILLYERQFCQRKQKSF